jgi:hypothetical protein
MDSKCQSKFPDTQSLCGNYVESESGERIRINRTTVNTKYRRETLLPAVGSVGYIWNRQNSSSVTSNPPSLPKNELCVGKQRGEHEVRTRLPSVPFLGFFGGAPTLLRTKLLRADHTN